MMVACLVGANGLHNLAGNDLDRIIHQYVVNSDCRFFVQINKVSRHGVAPPVCWNGIPESKRLKRTKNQLPALDELVHCRFGIRGECVEGVYELTRSISSSGLMQLKSPQTITGPARPDTSLEKSLALFSGYRPGCGW